MVRRRGERGRRGPAERGPRRRPRQSRLRDLNALCVWEPGQANLHVRGYKESGTTTTLFDMVDRNDLDRYRLVMDVIDRVPGLAVRAAAVCRRMDDTRLRHHDRIRLHGTDLPEVAEWGRDG
ncbi:hypothetical protein [Streptomyces sp. NBC_01235]|uniref:phosphoketolase family protein n=1 Tax=Streptomyces sp. NBC_01235 TaxID=2903788 RepID=UPI002E13A029